MRLAFHGGGKGKTSAALGIALRAAGHGLRVLYAGVMKTPYYQQEEVGEYKAMRRLGIHTLYLTDIGNPKLLYEYALEAADNYDVVILDEVLYAVRQGFLRPADLVKIRGVEAHLVATGNYWEPQLAELFDLVTRVEAEKHYYEKGAVAIRGLDW